MEVAKLVSLKRRYLKHLWPILLVAVVGLLYAPTVTRLAARWLQWDESMAHGLPTVVVFLVLLYQRAPEFVSSHPTLWERAFSGLGLLLASLLWGLSYRVNIDILEQLFLVAVLVASFAFTFGRSTAWRHRMLLLLPLFAIPFWDYLNGTLLYLSSAVVGQLVRFAEMPAVIEGSSIFIPHGHILIADGCSGLRYFVVALLLGYLVGLLNRYNEGRMAVTLLVAGSLGLMANWIRIFVLIVIGYQTRMQSDLMADHEMFGWILFALICLPAIYFAPVIKTRRARTAGWDESTSWRQRSLLVGVLLLGLSIGPVLALGIKAQLAQESVRPLLPTGVKASGSASMIMALMLPEADLTETAKLNDESVLRVDHYQRREASEELVPYIGRVYDSASWRQLDSRREVIEGTPVAWTRYKHKSDNRHVLQSQWFTLGTRTTDSVRAAKFWQIPAMLKGVSEFTVVSIQVPCEESDCTEAGQFLRHHAQRQIQQLNARKES